MREALEQVFADAPAMLTVKHIQAKTGYGRTTIYNWVNEGKWPRGLKNGQLVKWPKPLVIDHLLSLQARPPPS